MFDVKKHRDKIICVTLVSLLCATALILRIMYVKSNIDDLLEDYFDVDNTTNETAAAADIIQHIDDMDKSIKILNFIRRMNKYPYIHNDFLSGLTEFPSTFIVIHVSDDYFRFYNLMESLSQVIGITRALIIFAHDCYNDQANMLIGSIEFARYVQIFYPYNKQLLPNSFPGDDLKFCNNVYSCVRNNHTRNASLVFEKHFWWWHVNFVFEHLPELKYIPYYFLFLRYDQLVAEDLIYVFERMVQLMFSECPDCDMLNLGAHLPEAKYYHVHTASFNIEPLGSSEAHHGLAFNRSFWNKLKAQREDFCYFNDYMWYGSLKFVGSRMPWGRIQTFSPEGSRVFSTACSDGPDCDSPEMVMKVRNFTKLISRGLFPLVLDVNDPEDTEINVDFKAKGNWEDVRDQELCIFLTENKNFEFTL